MADAFCGWYFRCQTEDRTLALIPARHKLKGKDGGSIQIISDQGCAAVPFPAQATMVDSGKPRAVLGGNSFSPQGLSLDLQTPTLTAQGELRFGPPDPPRYDVMGPFRFWPRLECRHSVVSMGHTVNGVLRLNQREYRFRDGVGYIEGDRGRSFPRRYVWSQCSFGEGSLMLSLAEIPLGPLRFTGVISVIHLRGKEYRLATYLGAKALHIRDGLLIIRQGGLRLEAELLEKAAFPLQAPVGGEMERLIRENVCCRARYRLTENGRSILDINSDRAAFEFEYPPM